MQKDLVDDVLESLRPVITDLVEKIRKDFMSKLMGVGVSPPGKRRPGRPPTNPAERRARRKGGKRDPKELAKLVESLYAAIKRKPGSRIEEIGKAMSVATKDLALPVAKLLASKRIKKTGTRRATKYFPAK
jgi:hypothetical protein